MDEKASFFHDIRGNSKGTRVTVKVSKEQLQQLLKQADVEGLSSQDILGRLINVGEAHQRSWIHPLQDIPE
ncbi:hypothetical protein F511_00404 [Dorcoceras hygrometricum]|nr:hypothetical protein F511_00404 [Dorcoceras hygrometricum]